MTTVNYKIMDEVNNVYLFQHDVLYILETKKKALIHKWKSAFGVATQERTNVYKYKSSFCANLV